MCVCFFLKQQWASLIFDDKKWRENKKTIFKLKDCANKVSNFVRMLVLLLILSCFSLYTIALFVCPYYWYYIIINYFKFSFSLLLWIANFCLSVIFRQFYFLLFVHTIDILLYLFCCFYLKLDQFSVVNVIWTLAFFLYQF